MKKLILLLVVGISLGSSAVFAAEYNSSDYRRAAYAYNHGGRLDRQIDQLERMLSRVRWQIRQYRYRVDWRIRREVQDISGDVNRLNWKYRSGNYSSYRLRREIERLRDRLENVQERLRARTTDPYERG